MTAKPDNPPVDHGSALEVLHKITPGPWRVGAGGPNQCPTIGTHGGLMVAMVAHGEGHPTKANARAIAAVPALVALYAAAVRLDALLADPNASEADTMLAVIAHRDAAVGVEKAVNRG